MWDQRRRPNSHGDGSANHSHVCGINKVRSGPSSADSESFPRMWNQPLKGSYPYVCLRIIPTYVGSTGIDFKDNSPTANHSHVCGINIIRNYTALIVCESFPRMWDQLATHTTANTIIRIIPTYVGSTIGVVGSQVTGTESFPRMWDQHPDQISGKAVKRIIPTYVGSTMDISDVYKIASNHSHVCGINSRSVTESGTRIESFPRMWDQPQLYSVCHRDDRIIPTYVGSTCPSSCRWCRCSNHSHVCGINLRTVVVSNGEDESFPRMWDQPRRQQIALLRTRIIPTYVGSTAGHEREDGSGTNHSHVCGINVAQAVNGQSVVESFPRMWDQLGLVIRRPFELRIIPTYVGSTPSLRCSSSCLPNHSHVCGINEQKVSKDLKALESFPRMWDQRDARVLKAVLNRIIPTYVGSTGLIGGYQGKTANHSHVCGINRL
mgnify:CR=1 FL=1